MFVYYTWPCHWCQSWQQDKMAAVPLLSRTYYNMNFEEEMWLVSLIRVFSISFFPGNDKNYSALIEENFFTNEKLSPSCWGVDTFSALTLNFSLLHYLLIWISHLLPDIKRSCCQKCNGMVLLPFETHVDAWEKRQMLTLTFSFVWWETGACNYS